MTDPIDDAIRKLDREINLKAFVPDQNPPLTYAQKGAAIKAGVRFANKMVRLATLHRKRVLSDAAYNRQVDIELRRMGYNL